MQQIPREQSITAVQIDYFPTNATLVGQSNTCVGPATTLVAQLESFEAGLGRTVMGPTTPKKQRAAPQAAVLAHWERFGETVNNGDLALQLFDQGQPSLWEAYGLNDQLMSKLTIKAGGVRSDKTD